MLWSSPCLCHNGQWLVHTRMRWTNDEMGCTCDFFELLALGEGHRRTRKHWEFKLESRLLLDQAGSLGEKLSWNAPLTVIWLMAYCETSPSVRWSSCCGRPAWMLGRDKSGLVASKTTTKHLPNISARHPAAQQHSSTQCFPIATYPLIHSLSRLP